MNENEAWAAPKEWNPFENISDAFDLVRVLQEQGVSVHINAYASSPLVWCSMFRGGHERETVGEENNATASTVSEAIAAAALQTLEVRV